MPADVANPDFEPEWLWATRVTAEAARAAMVKGHTRQERFEIYERLILVACQERQRCKSSAHSGSIVEATVSTPGNLSYNYVEGDDSVIISGFEEEGGKGSSRVVI
jgi:hypothetical protein